ncbi:MAG: dTDP-4-dehydrorhamnose 3,5-epimerase [bacterium]
MKIISTVLPGVLIIEPVVFGDERGFFLETYQQSRYQEAGIAHNFIQDNHSRSQRGVLRGLHAQKDNPQGKLVRVSQGAVFDVAVDINPASKTFGQWVGVELNDTNMRQLWIPPGYAHGFQVLSETADFEYKCTAYYDPEDETGVIWNDPSLGIEWPLPEPTVSAKDQQLPLLEELQK